MGLSTSGKDLAGHTIGGISIIESATMQSEAYSRAAPTSSSSSSPLSSSDILISIAVCDVGKIVKNEQTDLK